MRHRFGNYELDEASAELRHAGRVVEIQPKPLALLALLVRERSRVVPARELLDALWPDTQVTLASLTRAVSHARRAIGDTNRGSLIKSVSRRGYRFCGDVLELDRASPPSEAASAGRDPALLFVGREEALGRLEDAFAAAVERRGGVALVTGRAGIGKTRLVEHFAARTARTGRARALRAQSRRGGRAAVLALGAGDAAALRQRRQRARRDPARAVRRKAGEIPPVRRGRARASRRPAGAPRS